MCGGREGTGGGGSRTGQREDLDCDAAASHREIWSWGGLQNCPTVGLVCPPTIAWRQPARGKRYDFERSSGRARPRRDSAESHQHQHLEQLRQGDLRSAANADQLTEGLRGYKWEGRFATQPTS